MIQVAIEHLHRIQSNLLDRQMIIVVYMCSFMLTLSYDDFQKIKYTTQVSVIPYKLTPFSLFHQHAHNMESIHR